MAEDTPDNAGRYTDFDPTVVNTIYSDREAEWELNRDFAEMHLKSLRDGEYLDRFGDQAGDDSPAMEAKGQWSWRKEQCFAIDYCADLINLRVDNLFRAPPVRNYEKSAHAEFIEAWLENVDGGGTDLTTFMRRTLRDYYVNGVDFVVDKDARAGEPATLAQERELGEMPYLHAFGPLDRVDWACDHAGAYLWARYKLGEAPTPDELEESPRIDQYLTVTRDEWRLYDVPKPEDDETPDAQRRVIVRSGPIALGLCPIVSFYFKQSGRADSPKVPLSLLTRVSPIARYLLNLLSQAQVDIYTSIAFWSIFGVDPASVPREITPAGVWAFTEAEAKVQKMTGDVGQIEAKLNLARMLMEAILRIGKIVGPAGELKGRAASGVQVAVERTDLDNEMRMTAAQAEQVEQELVWLAVCRYRGEVVPKEDLGYSVEYNRKYVLTPVGELIRHAQDFVSTGAHEDVPSALKILLRKIVEASTNEDDALYEQAMDEIEAATFGAMAPAEVVTEESKALPEETEAAGLAE